MAPPKRKAKKSRKAEPEAGPLTSILDDPAKFVHHNELSVDESAQDVIESIIPTHNISLTPDAEAAATQLQKESRSVYERAPRDDETSISDSLDEMSPPSVNEPTAKVSNALRIKKPPKLGDPALFPVLPRPPEDDLHASGIEEPDVRKAWPTTPRRKAPASPMKLPSYTDTLISGTISTKATMVGLPTVSLEGKMLMLAKASQSGDEDFVQRVLKSFSNDEIESCKVVFGEWPPPFQITNWASPSVSFPNPPNRSIGMDILNIRWMESLKGTSRLALPSQDLADHLNGVTSRDESTENSPTNTRFQSRLTKARHLVEQGIIQLQNGSVVDLKKNAELEDVFISSLEKGEKPLETSTPEPNTGSRIVEFDASLSELSKPGRMTNNFLGEKSKQNLYSEEFLSNIDTTNPLFPYKRTSIGVSHLPWFNPGVTLKKFKVPRLEDLESEDDRAVQDSGSSYDVTHVTYDQISEFPEGQNSATPGSNYLSYDTCQDLPNGGLASRFEVDQTTPLEPMYSCSEASNRGHSGDIYPYLGQEVYHIFPALNEISVTQNSDAPDDRVDPAHIPLALKSKRRINFAPQTPADRDRSSLRFTHSGKPHRITSYYDSTTLSPLESSGDLLPKKGCRATKKNVVSTPPDEPSEDESPTAGRSARARGGRLTRNNAKTAAQESNSADSEESDSDAVPLDDSGSEGDVSDESKNRQPRRAAKSRGRAAKTLEEDSDESGEEAGDSEDTQPKAKAKNPKPRARKTRASSQEAAFKPSASATEDSEASVVKEQEIAPRTRGKPKQVATKEVDDDEEHSIEEGSQERTSKPKKSNSNLKQPNLKPKAKGRPKRKGMTSGEKAFRPEDEEDSEDDESRRPQRLPVKKTASRKQNKEHASTEKSNSEAGEDEPENVSQIQGEDERQEDTGKSQKAIEDEESQDDKGSDEEIYLEEAQPLRINNGRNLARLKVRRNINVPCGKGKYEHIDHMDLDFPPYAPYVKNKEMSSLPDAPKAKDADSSDSFDTSHFGSGSLSPKDLSDLPDAHPQGPDLDIDDSFYPLERCPPLPYMNRLPVTDSVVPLPFMPNAQSVSTLQQPIPIQEMMAVNFEDAAPAPTQRRKLNPNSAIGTFENSLEMIEEEDPSSRKASQVKARKKENPVKKGRPHRKQPQKKDHRQPTAVPVPDRQFDGQPEGVKPPYGDNGPENLFDTELNINKNLDKVNEAELLEYRREQNSIQRALRGFLPQYVSPTDIARTDLMPLLVNSNNSLFWKGRSIPSIHRTTQGSLRRQLINKVTFPHNVQLIGDHMRLFFRCCLCRDISQVFIQFFQDEIVWSEVLCEKCYGHRCCGNCERYQDIVAWKSTLAEDFADFEQYLSSRIRLFRALNGEHGSLQQWMPEAAYKAVNIGALRNSKRPQPDVAEEFVAKKRAYVKERLEKLGEFHATSRM